jgi:hypothetical protein
MTCWQFRRRNLNVFFHGYVGQQNPIFNEVKIVDFFKRYGRLLLKNNPNRPFWLADPLLCSQNPDRSTFH